MQDAIQRRYGFTYDPSRNPSPPVDKDGNLLYPPPRPLYGASKLTDDEIVAEHGEWCRNRCYYPESKAAVTQMIRDFEIPEDGIYRRWK